MALPITVAEQVNFGADGSAFNAEGTSITTASSATVLTVGWWMVLNGAHNTVQYSPDSGTTWRTLIGDSVGGLVYSDGYNVRIENDATGGTSSFYTQLKGL